MEMPKCEFFVLIIFFTLLAFLPFFATSRELENQLDFDYVREGPFGPERWGDLRPDWATCKNGATQSPIDVNTGAVQVQPSLGVLQKFDKPANATLINRGHAIELKWNGDAGYIEIDGVEYAFKQCHWHSPSEHTIDGHRFPLEAHLLYQTDDNLTAVIALHYAFGPPDPFLSRIIVPYLGEIDQAHEETKVGLVDPKEIGIAYSSEYFRYNGSFTTPPCTQDVSWTIVKQVKSVAREQLSLLRKATNNISDGNSRPLQPLNKRIVNLFQSSF